MSYQRRMSIAGVAAVLLHVAAIAAVALYPRPSGPGTRIVPDDPPLVVNLQPAPRQLVDVAAPSETRPEDTDRIAETHSEATDTEAREADDDGPLVDVGQDFDALATTAEAGMAEAPPAPEAPAEPAPAPEAQETPAPAEAAPAPDAAPSQSPEPARSQVARRVPEPAAPVRPAEPPPEAPAPAEETPTPTAQERERTEIARATPPPGLPGEEAEQTAPLRGRTQGGVRQTGVAGFEAIQDDIAPYLRQIRAAVEREWTTALATRYTGSRPTEAVVECEIAPDGTVVRAEIMGAPADRIFAAICQTSIVRAGPFGPFPFDIPDMYRNRNLQIRWSFSFISR